MPNQQTNSIAYKVTVNSQFVQMLLDALPDAARTRLDKLMDARAAQATREAKPVPAGFLGFAEIESTDVDGYHVVFNCDLKERCLDIMHVGTEGCRCPVGVRGQQGGCRLDTYELDDLLKFVDTLAYIAASSHLSSVVLPVHVWNRYAEVRAPGQDDPRRIVMACNPYGQVAIEVTRDGMHLDICSLLALHGSGELARRSRRL
ncbi:hypothetical protein [Corallococcus silvisoli]|uniref:hypothetical protein n=1 Tax=Corallococcus silvisoli TaxID=2697031 RepID=UPI001376D9DB|nr:hypothetical protein [Corallococcus silvisoli]NBD09260.1 hypothetical protein [Corallococcus silvisoli]